MSSGAAGEGAPPPADGDDLQSRLAQSNGALQNLLRRLSTGMDDMLPNMHGRARMKELLGMLKSLGNEDMQMEALTEVCEVLSMGQEEMLIGFSVDAFLPILVDILNMEHRPEMMLMACRAITHLLEVIPKSAAKVAASGAVPIFCQRLLTIEFIDVAEQSLLAMHKLSVEHPEPILRANGLAAVLTFIDFFDLTTQRTAIATAANLCRCLPPDAFPLCTDMIPNMSQLLSSPDHKMTESACMCFARLIDACQTADAALEQLAAHGALTQLVRLLRPAESEGRSFELSTGTYTQVIKTLALACRCSPAIVVMLLEEGIVPVVHSMIKQDDDGPTPPAPSRAEGGGGKALLTAVAVNRPLEQLLHTLMLANELLPPLQADARATSFIGDIAAGTQMVQDLFGREGAPPLLRELTASKPSFLVEYSQLLFPTLVDISVTIVNEPMRITCLAAVAKLLMSLPKENLHAVVRQSQLLGYLSGFISSANTPVAGLSVMIAEMLLAQLPAELASLYAREGIVHEVGRLCAKESLLPDSATDALLTHAREMQRDMLGPNSRAGMCAAADSTMRRATEVSARLDDGEVEALHELRALLSPSCAESESLLSSYQVLNSGLAASVLKWLVDAVPERLVAFVEILAGRRAGAIEGDASPLRVLIVKVNEALSMREAFPVAVSDASGDLTAGLKLLAQPLKLRLMRDAGDTSIGDYGGNVVLIEPLATMNAVHDFLWPKVCQRSSPPPLSSPEAGGGDGTGLGGGGSDSSRERSPPPGEMGIMHDDASEEDQGMHGDEEEEEEEEDEDEDDVEDEEEDEEDEEVEADIARPTPSRPGAGSGVGGAAHGSDRDEAGAGSGEGNATKRRHLVFVVNGKPLSYKCPIIQAIGALGVRGDAPLTGARSGAEEGRGGGQASACQRAWEQVHTVLYRTVQGDESECSAADSPSAGARRSGDVFGGSPVADAAARMDHLSLDAGGGEGLAVLSSVRALQDALQGQLQLSDCLISEQALLALRLLRALAILNTSWEMLFDGNHEVTFPRRTLVSSAELINVKLAWKLMQQLQDPLMLCTGSLPSWCGDLTAKCGFLFPLECREYFTKCTAFGISRALHSMQQRVQGTSSSDRPTEVRIGRIQREKIRVSRSKILPSAMRALQLYASHRSVLEVEYYGEAGTGLGPTLEFFTLVSQELQAARLGLWRDQGNGEEDKPAYVGADDGAAEARPKPEHLPNDGLGQAPTQAGFIRGFHQICVVRCDGCTAIRLPRCHEHHTLFTLRTSDGGGACHRCVAGAVASGGGACKDCGGKEVLEWWMISEEEAAYMHSAFPAGQKSIDHILLQCPECRSVNFPGTEQCLVINRGGRMTSQSGRVMQEQDYRAVTRHASGACTNVPLTQVAVRLTVEECLAAANLIGSTPEAEESGDDVATAGSEGHVTAPYGLFPAPLQPDSASYSSDKVLAHFKFVGRLIGKGLLDQRHLDLPLSPAMLKVMVGHRLSFQDIGLLDPALYKTLSKLQAAAHAHAANPASPAMIDGCHVGDLGLTMTVPGYPAIELCEGGTEIEVTGENLKEYLEGVTEQVLGRGVTRQLDAFREGFDEVFPLRHLAVFMPEELEQHIRGDSEPWDLETLRASVLADHGFSETSMPIVWLLNIMTGMDKAHRRLFMRFVTGSPTLPAGGLRHLKPQLTVVRKEAEAPLSADDYLPSVMTCANYLKLPDYSSQEVLNRQLLVAMHEGQLSFLLS